MGILEAPHYKLPVINVGNRQKGRLNAGNVLYVGYNKKLIINALNKCCDHNFKQRLLKIKNPYGDSNSYKRVVSVIENIDLLDSKWLIKKKLC